MNKLEVLEESFSMDWSSLMADVQNELGLAESELRLLHMGGAHRRQAYMHIEKARIALKLLSGWCDG